MKKIFLTLTLALFVIPFTGVAQSEQRYANGTATDQDGNVFEWINYGAQDWAIENAEVVTYRDGTEIPQVTDDTEWANLTTGAWCYYGNDPSKGKLYNWYAVVGIHDTDPNTPNKEFAPEGWEIPSNIDVIDFYNFLTFNYHCSQSSSTETNWISKSIASKTNWNQVSNTAEHYLCTPGYNPNDNNVSGFNLMPNGNRQSDGMFSGEGSYGLLISKTEFDDNSVYNRVIFYNGVYMDGWYANSKRRGSTVRFVRDASSEDTFDILLNGTVSAENHQIKNIADPVYAQDAATKSYVDGNVNSFSGSYNDLTDKPTSFSGDLSGNVTSNFLKLNPLTQAEIDNLNPEAGTIVFNADSEKFIGYSGSAGQELDQSQENQNQLFDNPNTAQSFTAGSSGSLSKIDVKLSNGMYGQPDNNVTLTLREGEGTEGNVLFSTGLSTSSSTAEWISVDISGVEITQGSKYTIHLTSTSFFEDVFMWARDNTNPYPNGKSFYSNTAYTDYDLCFKTYISTTGWVDLN